MKIIKPSLSRRRVLAATLIPVLPSCAMDEDAVLRRKFKGIQGVVIRLDSSDEKTFIKILTEAGAAIASPAGLNNRSHQNLAFTGDSLPIPKSVHVTWREEAGWDAVADKWSDGTVVGDYIVPVASRIPEEVLDYIRVLRFPKGVTQRVLRIKLRLMDDGVLLGWDVEETQCHPQHRDWCSLIYPKAGGDFREALIYNGKVVEQGWYIGRDGKKIKTDY